MKEVQGKSILVQVIGSRLSLEDFARILKKKKDTVESFMLLLSPERYYGYLYWRGLSPLPIEKW